MDSILIACIMANSGFFPSFSPSPASVFEITIASAKFRDKAAAGMYEDFFGSAVGCIIDSNGCKIHNSGARSFFQAITLENTEFDQRLSISEWY